MPLTPEVRRLRGGWITLQARVAAYAATIPTDGVPLSTFEQQFFGGVMPADRPAILKALKGKRLIFPVRNGAVVRIFGQKPEARQFEPKPDDTATAFLKSAVPHMLRLAELAEAYGGPLDHEGRLREAEAVRQFARLARKYLSRGFTLPTMRDALWRTFNAEAMRVLARREPLFEKHSTVRKIMLPEPKPGKLPAGLPPLDRIVALASRAGDLGIGKNDLRRAFPTHCRPKAADLDAMIETLTEQGTVQAMIGRASNKGNPGLRIFAATASPRVLSDGRFATA